MAQWLICWEYWSGWEKLPQGFRKSLLANDLKDYAVSSVRLIWWTETRCLLSGWPKDYAHAHMDMAFAQKQWIKTLANTDVGITQAFNKLFVEVKVDCRPLRKMESGGTRWYWGNKDTDRIKEILNRHKSVDFTATHHLNTRPTHCVCVCFYLLKLKLIFIFFKAPQTSLLTKTHQKLRFYKIECVFICNYRWSQTLLNCATGCQRAVGLNQ